MSEAKPDLAPSTSAPALSRDEPLPVAAVADVLARSRLGCSAPVGAIVILAFGFGAATSNLLPLGPRQAIVFTVAVLLGAAAWLLVPVAMQRVRANARLRELGLSDAEITAVWRVATPILRESGGLGGEGAEQQIAVALSRIDHDKTR